MAPAAVAIGGLVGAALAPYLLVKAPLALVVLSPLYRHLLVAAPLTEPTTFTIIAVVRLFVADPFLYRIGNRFGPQALGWLEARSLVAGRSVQLIQRLFGKAGYLFVFVSPGVIVCTMAGVTGMPFRRFVAVNLVGTVLLVVLIRQAGDLLSAPILRLVELFRDHLGLLTAGSVVLTLVAWLLWRRRTRTRLAQLQGQSPTSGRTQ